MIRVRAPARLHFGLLSLPAEDETHWPDRLGSLTLPARRFGGVGLMIDEPALTLTVEPAANWSASGPLAERALAFAKQFRRHFPSVLPHRLLIESAPPEHCGFGTGTQLGLTVACALAESSGLALRNPVDLAQSVDRGQRSALGIHGFAHGGFLVEGGKRTPDAVSPLLARVPFPEEWRVVVAVADSDAGRHGAEERAAFRRLLDEGCPQDTDALCRLVLLGLLPALLERDLAGFGECLHDFNARAGAAFASVQGGTYASPQVAELVAFVRQLGVRGVGQSSWGPAVFAVVADKERASDLLDRVRRQFGGSAALSFVTRGVNMGAELT
jgi:beta-ribofuranosylaminobenzene 5'-phosphate synthase